LTAFFTSKVSEEIVDAHGHADVVICTQVLQHIPDLLQFLKDVVFLLKPDGVFVIEGRYFADTLRQNSFDTIYHEMLWFFTLTSLTKLLERVGMEVFEAEKVDIYGGSLRVYCRKKSATPLITKAAHTMPVSTANESVHQLILEESRLGIESQLVYMDFGLRAYKIREVLHGLIVGIKRDGDQIAAYGAPSTSATLLNFCGIGKAEISYVVDDNTLKQGKYTPGSHILIVPPTELEKHTPAFLLILAWRLQDDILPKVERYRKLGMSLIIPLSDLLVLF
jgi:hypothetical protein